MAGPLEVAHDAAQAVELGERLLRVASALEKRNTITETLVRGLSANGVLFSGIVRTVAVAAGGALGRHHCEVPYACLVVSDPAGVGPVVVGNDDPSALPVVIGAGFWQVAKSGREVVPLTGQDVWIWTPSTNAAGLVNVCAMSVPPYRVVTL